MPDPDEPRSELPDTLFQVAYGAPSIPFRVTRELPGASCPKYRAAKPGDLAPWAKQSEGIHGIA